MRTVRWLVVASVVVAGGLSAVSGGASAPRTTGLVWSAPKNIDGTNNLTAVACPTGTFCVAVDKFGQAMTWSDGTWSAPSTIDSGHSLVAVSCSSATYCVAVDDAGDAVVDSDGTWSSPAYVESGVSYQGGGFTSISCVAGDFCEAVSSYAQPYADYDNFYAGVLSSGSWSWQQVLPEYPPTAVSCFSSVFCMATWAKGWAYEYSDGSWTAGWDSPPIDSATVTGVACVSYVECLAIDGSGRVVQFNGTDWKAPVDIDGTTPLVAISCDSPTFCAVVDKTGHVMEFDGTTWTAPFDLDADSAVSSIACGSVAVCVVTEQYGYVQMATFKPQPTVAASTSPSGTLTMSTAKFSVKLTVSGSPTPTGTVQISLGSTKLASGALVKGHYTASIKTSRLKVGTNHLSVLYEGNAHYSPAAKTLSIKVVA